jgi:hypothetical protein
VQRGGGHGNPDDELVPGYVHPMTTEPWVVRRFLVGHPAAPWSTSPTTSTERSPTDVGVPAARSARAVDQGGEHVVVVAGDDVEPDALGAHRGALTDLGAATEAFAVVGLDHADRA